MLQYTTQIHHTTTHYTTTHNTTINLSTPHHTTLLDTSLSHTTLHYKIHYTLDCPGPWQYQWSSDPSWLARDSPILNTRRGNCMGQCTSTDLFCLLSQPVSEQSFFSESSKCLHSETVRAEFWENVHLPVQTCKIVTIHTIRDGVKILGLKYFFLAEHTVFCCKFNLLSQFSIFWGNFWPNNIFKLVIY